MIKNISKNINKNMKEDTNKNSMTALVSAFALAYHSKGGEPKAFAEFLAAASALFPKGSSLLFDYPACSGEESGSVHAKQKMMAKAAGEPMSRGYTYEELEKILAKHGFLIYEHLVPQDINQRFFKKYNQANPQNPLSAVADVNYCLAVKI